MKGNLLLVDDEAALVEMMKELLEDDGLRVFTALNGREGLRILREERIDCVVSDVKMPVMDGFTFIQEARINGHEIPFIFYSGHACERLKEQSLSLGACQLLAKPHFLELEDAIRDLLKVRLGRKELTAQI